MNRRNFLALIAIVWTGRHAAADDASIVQIKKTASCACCDAWADHLRQSGFRVAVDSLATGALMRFKLDHGVSPQLASCHTARIAGYTIEGHVPAREINRLLAERPAAIGLSVPGMPIGSPGMEVGERRDKYDVLLIRPDGTTEIYASYSERQH